MSKKMLMLGLLGFLFAETLAQSNSTLQKGNIPATSNARTIKPSEKPLSVNPNYLQPKQAVEEETTVFRTPRKLRATNATQRSNTQSGAENTAKKPNFHAQNLDIDKKESLSKK